MKTTQSESSIDFRASHTAPVVRFDQDGSVGHLVLCNQPDNALGRRFTDDLTSAIRLVSTADIRALVVRTEGPNFGTGGDVAEWPGKTLGWFQSFISDVNWAYKTLESLRFPTIAAVRGKAIGGHFELILHCDLIITAPNASFHAIELKTGMVPLAGGLQRLAERIGRGRTTDFVFFSEPISGSKAGEIGLASRVVADNEVDSVATQLAERLAAGPTVAYGTARALLKAWSSGGVAGADDLLLDLTMRLFETEDAQQAFSALKAAVQGGGDKSESEAAAKVRFRGR